jgi:hypothetical protein
MPASKIDVELTKIRCDETEGFVTNDKIYVTCSTDVAPKNGTQVKDMKRIPSGATWEFNNDDERTINEPLFSIDDFEGKVELFLTMYDQDTDESIPDEVIDEAVERIKETMDEVASAAGSTGVGLPVAGAILMAKPFADAVGSILKLTTSFDPSDTLGTKRIRIDTDRGARDETVSWWAVDDGAEYEAFIKVVVTPY